MDPEPLNRASAPDAPSDTVAAQLAHCLEAFVRHHYDAERHALDYGAAGVSREFRALREAVDHLAGFDPDALGPVAHRLAFWMNVYNALALHIVIEHRLASGVRGVDEFFTGPHYRIGGASLSLDVIEHGILRGNRRKYMALGPVLGRRDPRIAWALPAVEPTLHFGLHTACRSAPRLRAFHADHARKELAAAAREYLDATVHWDAATGQLYVPRVFKWYAGDFGGRTADTLSFVATHLAEGDQRAAAIEAQSGALSVQFQDYDWSLNDRYAAAPPA